VGFKSKTDADEIGVRVWSLDDDFEGLERLKLVRMYS
jgi:hypothetical protein